MLEELSQTNKQQVHSIILSFYFPSWGQTDGRTVTPGHIFHCCHPSAINVNIFLSLMIILYVWHILYWHSSLCLALF